jgi:hypothetical protein
MPRGKKVYFVVSNCNGDGEAYEVVETGELWAVFGERKKSIRFLFF